MGREDDAESDDSVGKTNGGEKERRAIFGLVCVTGGCPRDGKNSEEAYRGSGESFERFESDAENRKGDRSVNNDERQRRVLAQDAERKRKRLSVFDSGERRNGATRILNARSRLRKN